MASTNFVDNSSVIYASWLNNVNEAVYNGNFQATTISPVNLVCNGSVSGTGFNGLVNSALGSPAAIGNGTPNTGAFTTLTLTNALGVSYGGTGTTTSTGSGATVRATSPALVTPDLGTPSTLIGTNITGTSNSLNAGIGVNQTWQSFAVGTARVVGTTYTNSTGKPIQVSLTGINNAVSNIFVGGVNIAYMTYQTVGVGGCTSFIVPNGSTYVIASGSVAIWAELR